MNFMNYAFETEQAERFCTLDFLLGQTAQPTIQPAPIAPPPSNPIPALVQKIQITSDMTFKEAAERWLSSIVSRKAHTMHSYSKYVKAACLFFGDMRLCDVARLDHIVAYQKARLSGDAPFIRYRRPHDAKPTRKNGIEIPAKGKTPCPAQPKKVNQELGVVIRILRRAGVWTEQHSELYEQLPEEIAEIPRALTPEEQKRWLETAGLEPRWHLVYWYSLLALDTCMSTNELRALRIQDIDFTRQTIRVSIEGSKNKYRHRDISVHNPYTLSALQWLLKRAHDLGSRLPQHYLFPLREGGNGVKATYDPNKPMTESGIRKLWNEVRAAAHLGWFRPYDTRHTAITRLAEAGVPISAIKKLAGHVSEQMNEHYTHLSEGYMRQERERADWVYAMRSRGGQEGGGGSPASFGIQMPPMPFYSPR